MLDRQRLSIILVAASVNESVKTRSHDLAVGCALAAQLGSSWMPWRGERATYHESFVEFGGEEF